MLLTGEYSIQIYSQWQLLSYHARVSILGAVEHYYMLYNVMFVYSECFIRFYKP